MLGKRTDDGVEIFCSYSHCDEKLLKEFSSHLAILRHTKGVVVWTDLLISVGDSWEDTIASHLNSAEVVVLLVSADFINSDFCYTKEMTRAMERREAKEALVVPIIVRPCLWQDAPFGKLQALPPGARPVTEWDNRDRAWTEVAAGLNKVVEVAMKRSVEKQIELAKATGLQEIFNTLQSRKADFAQAKRIVSTLETDSQKSALERWKILQETQNKIFEIQADVRARRSLVDNAAFKKWDEYIRA